MQKLENGEKIFKMKKEKKKKNSTGKKKKKKKKRKLKRFIRIKTQSL